MPCRKPSKPTTGPCCPSPSKRSATPSPGHLALFLQCPALDCRQVVALVRAAPPLVEMPCTHDGEHVLVYGTVLVHVSGGGGVGGVIRRAGQHSVYRRPTKPHRWYTYTTVWDARASTHHVVRTPHIQCTLCLEWDLGELAMRRLRAWRGLPKLASRASD